MIKKKFSQLAPNVTKNKKQRISIEIIREPIFQNKDTIPFSALETDGETQYILESF